MPIPVVDLSRVLAAVAIAATLTAGLATTTPALAAPAVPAPPAAAMHPPTPDEQKAFADGLRQFEAGDARGAERTWKQGYAVAHDPAFLVRIAEAQEKAGAPREAVQTYEQYLRAAPQAADRDDIEARLNRLNPQRPRGHATEADTDIPGEMRGAPGGSTPGTPAASGVPGTPGAPASATPPGSGAPAGANPGAAAAAAASAPPPSPPGAAAQARDDSLQDLMPLIQDEPPRSRLNVAAWIGTGATVLLLGVAAFYGASAAEKSGDANRLLTYSDSKTGVPQEYSSRARQFEEDVRVGRRDDKLAKGFLLAAGVTAAAATVLFVVDGSSTRRDPEASTSASNSMPGQRRDGMRLTVVPTAAAGTGAGGQASLSWPFWSF